MAMQNLTSKLAWAAYCLVLCVQWSHAETPTSFDKNALEDLKGKTVTWEGVVEKKVIVLLSEPDCAYLARPEPDVNLPKDGERVIITGTVIEVRWNVVQISFAGGSKRLCAVDISMKNCTIK
jgi:hypothetical protein